MDKRESSNIVKKTELEADYENKAGVFLNIVGLT